MIFLQFLSIICLVIGVGYAFYDEPAWATYCISTAIYLLLI